MSTPPINRHLDQYWRPSATFEALAARARMLARIRAFFAEREVLEVETPILSRHATTDPALESLCVDSSPMLGRRWLQTSPEFPMKRLLAAGSGPIYQICKVFRDQERGARHHPEFTLLEWYRPGWTMHQLIAEIAELVRAVLKPAPIQLEHVRYRDLFLSRLEIDPWSASLVALREAAIRLQIPGAAELDLDGDGWLDLLLSHCLEADLGRECMTFVYDYPPSQAALARIRDSPFPVAERFELYIEGMELANGFQELTDAVEQRRRFDRERQTRRRQSRADLPMDVAFLDALAAGMPESAGVALGLDRLLMIDQGTTHIDQVLAFPTGRA